MMFSLNSKQENHMCVWEILIELWNLEKKSLSQDEKLILEIFLSNTWKLEWKENQLMKFSRNRTLNMFQNTLWEFLKNVHMMFSLHTFPKKSRCLEFHEETRVDPWFQVSRFWIRKNSFFRFPWKTLVATKWFSWWKGFSEKVHRESKPTKNGPYTSHSKKTRKDSWNWVQKRLCDTRFWIFCWWDSLRVH